VFLNLLVNAGQAIPEGDAQSNEVRIRTRLIDGSRVEEFKSSGGTALVQKMALKAMELSKQRAASVRKALIETQGIDAARIETVGRGWQEPLANAEPEAQRRVEVQWFALE